MNSLTKTAESAREARAIAKIGSPHVVQVLDHGVLDDDSPYIAMELLKGRNLQHYLDGVQWMSVAGVVALVDQLGKAPAAAHSKGVVHRDIKPDNIILIDAEDAEEIFIKLIDFGVAKEVGPTDTDLTSEGAMIGSPKYMSPEQFGGAHAMLLRLPALPTRSMPWPKPTRHTISRSRRMTKPGRKRCLRWAKRWRGRAAAMKL